MRFAWASRRRDGDWSWFPGCRGCGRTGPGPTGTAAAPTALFGPDEKEWCLLGWQLFQEVRFLLLVAVSATRCSKVFRSVLIQWGEMPLGRKHPCSSPGWGGQAGEQISGASVGSPAPWQRGRPARAIDGGKGSSSLIQHLSHRVQLWAPQSETQTGAPSAEGPTMVKAWAFALWGEPEGPGLVHHLVQRWLWGDLTTAYWYLLGG